MGGQLHALTLQNLSSRRNVIPVFVKGHPMADNTVHFASKRPFRKRCRVWTRARLVPQCRFPATVVNVLTHMIVKFSGVNVLDDMWLYEGINGFQLA